MDLKLGKKEAKYDPRTISLKSILKVPELPPLPDEWEFSRQHPEFDISPKMWGNDSKGDCVMVASVAQQRDFEVIEQSQVIPVDENQLIQAYLKEAGGDYGLVMLDHLKIWKNDGLPIGTKKKWCKTVSVNYKCHAFASIDWTDQNEIKYAVMLLGCNIGASMPDSYMSQFGSGHPWDDTTLPSSPRNGHAMKVRGWTKDGLLLWTWGKLQLASWPWVFKYLDEAWVIIDDRDSALSILDVDKLNGFLQAIKQ